MAVNLDAIRKRILELSGQSKNSSVQLWKPTVGEYRVRPLPWKDTTPEQPIKELRFYYLGEQRRILAPIQFNKPDPIAELTRKLYSSGSAEDRELAKKLRAKTTAYIPIIVRGQEDKGVLVWSLNPFLYQRMLSFFTDEDGGDYLDHETGNDLKVALVPSKKVYNGKAQLDTNIDLKRSCKLSDDPAQAKKWLDAIPDLNDLYKLQTYDEISSSLNTWLDSGTAIDPKADGAARGAKPKDDLDLLKEEIAAQPVVVESKKAAIDESVVVEKTATKKASKKAVSIDDDDDAPKPVKQSLEDAFADLMVDES
jgi:hypothetical protein